MIRYWNFTIKHPDVKIISVGKNNGYLRFPISETRTDTIFYIIPLPLRPGLSAALLFRKMKHGHFTMEVKNERTEEKKSVAERGRSRLQRAGSHVQ